MARKPNDVTQAQTAETALVAAMNATENGSGWRKNDYGLKDSVDMYRTVAGERYDQWSSGPTEEVHDCIARFLRSNGIKCRRLGVDLFVRANDHPAATELLFKYPDDMDPELVAARLAGPAPGKR